MNEKENPHPKQNPNRNKSKSGSPESEIIELNLNLPSENDEDGITLKDILTIFRNGLPKIIVFTLIALLAGVLSAFIYYFSNSSGAGTITGVISFNYKGAEEGLDPHGRQLDVDKIKSPYVLEKAVSELGLYDKGITAEDIRQNIVISGIVPDDAMDRIMVIREIATKDPSKLEELISVSYIPTQWVVSLKIPKKLSYLKGSKGVELLDAIFNSYKDYFFEEYTDKSILSTAAASLPYSEYDYDDTVRVLSEQITNIITYLSTKRSEAPEFRASSTQMSFGDIINNLDLLRSIDLVNVRSIINVRLLTKDRAQLISSYQYNISQKELERDIQIEKARITKEAAESYQKDSAMYFSGTGDPLQISQSSATYDSLINQAAEASEAAIRLQSDIDYYQKRLDDFNNAAIRANNAADITSVEAAIDTISEKMTSWTKIINDTVDEYMEVLALKDAAKVVLLPHYTSDFSSGLKMIGLVIIGVTGIGFVLGVISVYGKSIMS